MVCVPGMEIRHFRIIYSEIIGASGWSVRLSTIR
jgi:hypothetical protein